MTEIVNVKEVASIAGRIVPEPGHHPLLEALRRRYPSSEFNLVSMNYFNRPIGALIGKGGETVADDYKVWVTGEYHSAGGDAKAVYNRHHEAGMAISEEEGEHIVITIPYGEPQEAFLQLELDARRMIAECLILDWEDPDDLEELLLSSSCLPTPRVLSPWRYNVRTLTNVAAFLRDLTDLERAKRRSKFPGQECQAVRGLIAEDRMAPVMRAVPPRSIDQHPKEVRFFLDWRESSAGLSGARLCARWWLDVADLRPYGGGLSYIPRWADSDCSFPYVSLGSRWSSQSPGSITSPPDYSLPRIEASAYPSVYALMAALEDFDHKAGYPMAWYFYMLHGNRVEQEVGDVVAKAVREGRIGLPEHDARVLARWREKSYGF